MGMSISKPYRFICLSEDIEEVKKMREYNNQVIPNKSTAIAIDTNEQFIFQDGKWRKMTIKMTIDEAITWLNTDDFESKGFADATGVAIDTMCKYQKIEEAYTKYQNDVVTNIYADKKFVEALGGIFKNGNDD